MSSYVPAALRRKVVERARSVCEYCLVHEEDTFFGCEVEHIVSEKHGGATDEPNLALACAFCNRAKGTDIATFDPQSNALSRLYHPRTDRWSEHFRLDGFQITGITVVGRATISLLGLNEMDRLIEREALSARGRFPSAAAVALVHGDSTS